MYSYRFPFTSLRLKTVSALHARIQKKEEILLVTDLDSTNGTFIDDKRLRPGVVAAASPGTCITFGNMFLTQFPSIFLDSAFGWLILLAWTTILLCKTWLITDNDKNKRICWNS